MKAVVNHQYGSPDVLRLEEVEKPVPKNNEVLIRVHAVSINGSDWEGLTGKPLYARIGGLRKPSSTVLGGDIAGVVEAVGSEVAGVQPGDAVYGETLRYHDGFAEYVCVREKALARKPAGITFEEAAAIPQAGVIALQGIRDQGRVQQGQQVLINGAGGGAGMFAVQLAKLHGAVVTGVDRGGKLDFLRSLGADHVVDFTREDFSRMERKYDLILDVAGYRSVRAYQRSLKPGGSYLFVGGSVRLLFQVLLLGPVIRRTTGKTMRILAVQPNRKDLETVTALCESGKLRIAIDRVYTLEQAPEAMRYVGEGRAQGKVVIRVA